MAVLDVLSGLLASGADAGDGRSMWESFVGSFRRSSDGSGLHLPGWVWFMLATCVMVGLSLLLSRWMGSGKEPRDSGSPE